MQEYESIYMSYPDGRFITEGEDGYKVYINERTTLPGVFITPMNAEIALEGYRKEEAVIQEKRNAGKINAGGRGRPSTKE